MKRALLFAAALGLSLSSQAWAGLSVGDDVRMTSGQNPSQGQTGGGGPFKAELFDDNTSAIGNHASDLPYATFLSFCVQKNENLSGWNNLSGLSQQAISTSPVRTLTGYAAWAYEKFVTTSGVNVGNVGSADQDLLSAYQFAIWGGMVDNLASAATQVGTAANSWQDFNANVTTVNWLPGVHTVGALLAHFGLDTTSFAASGWSGGYGDTHLYQIMNLTSAPNGQGQVSVYQDQIIVPSGSLDVPEPASLAVWSILAGGAAGLSVARRRRAATRGRWSNDNREAILSVIEGKHGH